MNPYRQMYMVNQDQYNILQKMINPSPQIDIPTIEQAPIIIPSIIPTSSTSTTAEPSATSATTERALYTCPICNKSFDKRLNLKYHKRIHKKPTCEIDNREFDHPNILAHHMKKQHVDGYKCKISGEIKKSQSELNKHLKTHKKPKKPRNLLKVIPTNWVTP